MAVPRTTKSDTQRKQNDILFYFLVRATYFLEHLGYIYRFVVKFAEKFSAFRGFRSTLKPDYFIYFEGKHSTEKVME